MRILVIATLLFCSVFATAAADLLHDALPVLPEDIAPTPISPGVVTVEGQPRQAVGHPCTLWDQQDLADLQAQLKTEPVLQRELQRLKSTLDQRIAKPLGVPEAEQDADGHWLFPGDALPGTGTAVQKNARVNITNALTISDLGTLYALTGDAKYGEFCKAMLLAYAANFPHYGHPALYTQRGHRSEFDGRLTDQFLGDGGWLITAARGYDLVYNLPTWTDAQRAQVRTDLFEAVAAEFTDDILGPLDFLSQKHNRSVICTSGVLMAGYACDSPLLIQQGLYGKNGTPEHPTGGVFGVHFTERCFAADGLWNEGSMGYQFMALGALLNDAEVLWRHGIDLYRYRNGALKGLFDSALQFAYPDLTLPATHDSARMSILTSWFTDFHQAFEYGYLRYRDPRYLTIINNVAPHLALSIHDGPTSVFFDRHPDAKPSLALTNTNFTSVGYGLLRVPTPHGLTSLLLEYGPSGSHGHPSKLGLDLYAQDDVLAPDPGVVFPYNYPLDTKWYWTTPAHNTLTVDQAPQIYGGNRWKFPRNQPEPTALQQVYCPGETAGMQRAYSDSVYPGVMQERAIFVTRHYVADLFSAVSTTQHTYDLAWHVKGTPATDLPLEPFTFPAPVADGYSALTDVRHATTDQGWTIALTRPGHVTRLLAAGGTPTEVITGTGYSRTLKNDEPVPTIMLRRANTAATLFATALDVSDQQEVYLTGIRLSGGVDAGYGLATLKTSAGTDLCFMAFRPGRYTAEGMETDAQQSMVLRNGDTVEAMYLAGGTLLRVAGGSLRRDQPGLAIIERLDTPRTYRVANPSPHAATLTVTLPQLAGLKAYTIDATGRRTGPATVKADAEPGTIRLQLDGTGQVIFAP